MNCLIWSGEHGAWWRRGIDGSGEGYTDNRALAGRWDRAEAARMTAHCGPEKQIELHDAPEEPPTRDPALVEKLIEAAELVACRWSVFVATNGKLGHCGLPSAVAALKAVLDELDPEDAAAPDDNLEKPQGPRHG